MTLKQIITSTLEARSPQEAAGDPSRTRIARLTFRPRHTALKVKRCFDLMMSGGGRSKPRHYWCPI